NRESCRGAPLNCKIAARSTDQSSKNEYFKIHAHARDQGVSEFFTGDYLVEGLWVPGTQGGSRRILTDDHRSVHPLATERRAADLT
ncbi:MAG TPA: hypothetical protein VMB83_08000, partial [Roseiarcus sp.]|nr:hypothetical protein [Roseiarcus sp.]